MQDTIDRLVNCKQLRKSPLWPALETEFKFGGVRVSMVQERIKRLEACDDLTANEVEWLAALKQALVSPA